MNIGMVIGMQSHAMFHDALHPVEEALVVHEIQERGKLAALNEMAMTTPVHTVTSKGCEKPALCTASTVLKIQRLFHEKDAAESPLTKMVFETIKRIEEKDGYISEAIDRGKEYIYATNYFGLNTRYYWQGGGRHSSTVYVEANLTNKAALQELVETYKEEI
jgi:hypothetical protein